ncbi:MAG: hypothetical protein J4432_05555 [DPANN group archaeon]|nr:hypothetical protein [DPANN group archaeon]
MAEATAAPTSTFETQLDDPHEKMERCTLIARRAKRKIDLEYLRKANGDHVKAFNMMFDDLLRDQEKHRKYFNFPSKEDLEDNRL